MESAPSRFGAACSRENRSPHLFRRLVAPIVEQGVTPGAARSAQEADPAHQRAVAVRRVRHAGQHPVRLVARAALDAAARTSSAPSPSCCSRCSTARATCWRRGSLCLVVSNLIVLGNAVAARARSPARRWCSSRSPRMPFALFDLSDRVPLASGVALSIACFALVEVGLLAGLSRSVRHRLGRRLLPVLGGGDAGGRWSSACTRPAPPTPRRSSSCGTTSPSACAPSASWPRRARRRSTRRRWPPWAR